MDRIVTHSGGNRLRSSERYTPSRRLYAVPCATGTGGSRHQARQIQAAASACKEGAPALRALLSQGVSSRIHFNAGPLTVHSYTSRGGKRTCRQGCWKMLYMARQFFVGCCGILLRALAFPSRGNTRR